MSQTNQSTVQKTSEPALCSKEGVADQEKQRSKESQSPSPGDYIYLAGVAGIILTLIWYAPQIKEDSERTQINRQLLIDITQENCLNLTHRTDTCDRIFREIARQIGDTNGTSGQTKAS